MSRVAVDARAQPQDASYDSDGGELDWNDHVSFEVNSILEELEEYYRDYSLTLYALSDPTSYDDPYAEFKEPSENPEGSP